MPVIPGVLCHYGSFCHSEHPLHCRAGVIAFRVMIAEHKWLRFFGRVQRPLPLNDNGDVIPSIYPVNSGVQRGGIQPAS